MSAETEVVIDEAVLGEKQIEPFDWEDYLNESWLEEKQRQKRNRPGNAGVSI